MAPLNFDSAFTALTGNAPFPWQRALYDRFVARRDDNIPASCNLPTGLGKTSVIAVWLIALANGANVPRRLVYVVNRRTVVDQTTDEVENLRKKLPEVPTVAEALWGLCSTRPEKPGPDKDRPLAISTLRGQFADNREWSADPVRPAVICGTVDMIGSRLLFSGYGCGFKTRPLHAGFLGQDALVVHDEAHLEPAFQELLKAIEKEQREGRTPDFRPLKVMELTATSRAGGEAFELTKEEKDPPAVIPEPPRDPIHHVWRRLKAKKGLRLHAEKRGDVAKKIGQLARDRKASGKAILVFVRTIDDVKTVQDELTAKKGGVPTDQVQVLTGTLRGLERDGLANSDPVFARFLPKPKVLPKPGTVYLVCTSAGEVGVDISADHMVCDLTTLDSMAQRLGRVNRRGNGAAEVDVVFEGDPDPKKKDDPFENARWKTKEVLERLPNCDWIAERREASPLSLRTLNPSEGERKTAFAPTPTILPVTDILFDAWALTTIRDKLPGRPPVDDYLHGISDYDPPQTTVAWRDEVELMTGAVLQQNKLDPEKALDLFPLKPHEELSGATYGKNKVFEQLEAIAERDAKREPDKRLSAWVIDPDGTATIHALAQLVEKDKQNKPVVALCGRTVLLPPHAGGLAGGLLKGDEPHADGIDYDVSGRVFADPERTAPRRLRLREDDERILDVKKSMRLIRRIDFPAAGDDEDAEGRAWLWFERPQGADDEGSKAAATEEPISWDHHTNDVTNNTKRIVKALGLDDKFQAAFTLAAKLHDLGKQREVWQRSIGNPNPKGPPWFAKSSRKWTPREITDYRHEFGSLLDTEQHEDFAKLDDDLKAFVLHVIATHHGRGRPHFPTDEAFDPEPKSRDVAKVAREVPQRFARLQRKFGRWGLAYLESLLRAADYAASASPSKFEPEDAK